MLARPRWWGSLLSLLRCWLNRGEKESLQAMNELFHGMVWKGLAAGAVMSGGNGRAATHLLSQGGRVLRCSRLPWKSN